MCLIRNFRCSSENIRYAMGSKGGLSHIQTTTRCNGRVDELLPKLAKVNNFKIPRCILLPATERIEIHGFSDASERAYAAVVYIKCFNESGQSQTRLLCSKSRVAPLKTLTIPRLELSAALLLSRLVKRVVPILQLSIHKIWMWTDSTIALAWIKTEPHKLKTFVSNRVAEIQALSKDYHWKHVSSKNNPDDLISRGCNVDELLKNEMWFSGPDLQTDEYEDNQLFPDPSYRDELKCAVTLSMTEFINNIKAKESCNKEKYLTADEVKRSTEFLAKIAQLSEFKAEIDALKKGKGVSKTQQRNKWQFEKNNVAVGCLVLLKENDLPPCKWTMARILEVIYGTDGKGTFSTELTVKISPRELMEGSRIDPLQGIEVTITFQDGDRFNSCQVIYSQFGLAIHQNDHQSLVYADKPQTLDHLEDNIRRVIAGIRPQMLEKVIENWTSRLDYIRASRFSHMPEIIFKIYTGAFGDGPRNLNHGQVTWTTPELVPPLLTTTPHQRDDVSALDRFNVHRCPTRRVFSGTGLEPVTKQATVRYLYHSATVAVKDPMKCNNVHGCY
ncbi:DUF1758 domain-containing protein [Trichonephila clavipes]|nr:DUF1758 domain-containing protein [Trichonephila clavipes]